MPNLRNTGRMHHTDQIWLVKNTAGRRMHSYRQTGIADPV